MREGIPYLPSLDGNNSSTFNNMTLICNFIRDSPAKMHLSIVLPYLPSVHPTSGLEVRGDMDTFKGDTSWVGWADEDGDGAVN